jgi:hypothetical protein
MTLFPLQAVCGTIACLQSRARLSSGYLQYASTLAVTTAVTAAVVQVVRGVLLTRPGYEEKTASASSLQVGTDPHIHNLAALYIDVCGYGSCDRLLGIGHIP